MMIPAIEAETAEAKAKPEGSIPCATRYTMPAPSAKARMKNRATEYLAAKSARVVAEGVNLASPIEPTLLVKALPFLIWIGSLYQI
jgi:hypothetical protein